MKNVIALGLLFTSLVAAGFFSPNHEKHDSGDSVIVKEGNRVVLEFEKEDGNTKISISSKDPQRDEEKGSFADDAKEKLSESMEEMKGESSGEGINHRFSPRELVCDAYGKCKHKIASVIGKTKETVEEKAHEVAEKVAEVGEEAEEAVGEAVGKVKDAVAHTAGLASDKTREAEETAKNVAYKAADKAREGKDAAEEVSSKAKERVTEKSNELKQTARDEAEKAKSEVEEMVENASNKAKRGAQRAKEEGKKDLGKVMDALSYLVPPVSMGSAAGVLHLLGFGAAYGMCIWVTFASSYILAISLPRQQFAMVQSKIYPAYFKAMAYSVGIALFGHLLSHRKSLTPTSVGTFQAFNLVGSLAMILMNLLYLEPRATKVVFERMKKEKEEGRGKEADEQETSGKAAAETAAGGSIQEKQQQQQITDEAKGRSEVLKRLNSYSSFLNVLTLMCLTCHLVYLGQRLNPGAC